MTRARNVDRPTGDAPDSPALQSSRDVSIADPRDESVLCAWCGATIPGTSATGRRRRSDARTCSKRCRQNRSRWKIAQSSFAAAAQPMKFAYADPPYPGRASYYSEKTEVDHAALIARLMRDYPDGWALSTAADALSIVLPLCPAGVRVASWHRRPRPTQSRRAISAWEPLLLYGGRELPLSEAQTVTDALTDHSRHHAYPGALVGMKTPSFAEWLFQQLGARPGDDLDDLYPGSGAIGKAWAFFIGDPAA